MKGYWLGFVPSIVLFLILLMGDLLITYLSYSAPGIYAFSLSFIIIHIIYAIVASIYRCVKHRTKRMLNTLWSIYDIMLMIASICLFIACIGMCQRLFTGKIAYDTPITGMEIGDQSYGTFIPDKPYAFDQTRTGCKSIYLDNVITDNSYWSHTCVGPIMMGGRVHLWVVRMAETFDGGKPNLYKDALTMPITRTSGNSFIDAAIQNANGDMNIPIFTENSDALNIESYIILSNVGWIIMGIALIISLTTCIPILICESCTH